MYIKILDDDNVAVVRHGMGCYDPTALMFLCDNHVVCILLILEYVDVSLNDQLVRHQSVQYILLEIIAVFIYDLLYNRLNPKNIYLYSHIC